MLGKYDAGPLGFSPGAITGALTLGHGHANAIVAYVRAQLAD
jgi:hypothetical protein